MRVLPLLLFAVVLAGCSSPPAAEPAPTSTSASLSSAPAPTPALPAVFVGHCDVSSGIAYGTGPAVGSSQPASCPFSAAGAGDFLNFTAAVVEAVWSPGASVTGADLIVQSDTCYSSIGADSSGVHDSQCNIGTAQGSTSPLRIEIAADLLRQYARTNMTAEAIPQGVSTAQPFTIYITLFEGPMPAGYSAIPA